MVKNLLIILVLISFVVKCSNNGEEISVTGTGYGYDSLQQVDNGSKLRVVNDSRDLGAIIDTSLQIQNFSDAFDDFSFEIFQKLQEKYPQENIIISPVAIAAMLSLSSIGSSDDNHSQFLSLFNSNQEYSPVELYSFFQRVMQIYTQDTLDIEIINSMWVHSDYQVHSTFYDIAQNHYNTDINLLTDVDNINNHYAEKSLGLINPAITDNIDSEIEAITGALFNAEWKYGFDDDRKVEAGERTYIAKQSSAFFKRGDYYTAVKLPYETEGVYFYGFYENANLGVDGFVEKAKNFEDAGYYEISVGTSRLNMSWTPVEDQNIYDGFQYLDNIYYRIPEFDYTFRTELSDIIDAVSPEFSFANNELDQMHHTAYVSFSSDGGEGSPPSSTGVIVINMGGFTSYRLNVELINPFFFAIRDDNLGINLFMGQVISPISNN